MKNNISLKQTKLKAAISVCLQNNFVLSTLLDMSAMASIFKAII